MDDLRDIKIVVELDNVHALELDGIREAIYEVITAMLSIISGVQYAVSVVGRKEGTYHD